VRWTPPNHSSSSQQSANQLHRHNQQHRDSVRIHQQQQQVQRQMNQLQQRGQQFADQQRDIAMNRLRAQAGREAARNAPTIEWGSSEGRHSQTARSVLGVVFALSMVVAGILIVLLAMQGT
jgi:hypothetical protein